MQVPRIRAMRLNAAVLDFKSTRKDASIGLNKCGLFSFTLGGLTAGCSLELTDLARKLGVKEQRKVF
ncbi:hypothetical protein PHMEG_00024977 [Phytophthora megakarya]|uniref:Uncharacterized protein n=1 Tax=Phytophthora megakarya TaxID=4795 RepID=A0A225VD60_9STRA|nr:hypothetical protein PHMEG_00024977 [Phytophthora megakarya]